jgi:hypothetical protein
MASEVFDNLPDGTPMDEATLAGYFRDYYPGALSGQALTDAITNAQPGALFYDLDNDGLCLKNAANEAEAVPTVSGEIARYKILLPTGQNVGGGDLGVEKSIVFTGATVVVVQGPTPIVSASGIEIPTDLAGWWELEAHLNYDHPGGTSHQRFTDFLRFVVDGTSTNDGRGIFSYIRDTSNNEEGGNTAKTWLNLSAGQVIGLSSSRESGGSGPVELASGCQLLMTKLT